MDLGLSKLDNQNNQNNPGNSNNLSKLDKTTLLKQTHETVKREKYYTTLLLRHLLEIENRSLHLEQGFYNLHNFLVVEFKYSDSEAATRVQAMRLLRDYPIVDEKISLGKISLSQAADINRFLTRETSLKTTGGAALTQNQECLVSIEKIMEEVQGMSVRKSKEILEKLSSVPKEKSYTIEIDEETWQLLQEIKKREVSTASDGDFTKKIFRERLKKYDLKLKPENQIGLKEPKVKIKSRFIGKKIKWQLLKAANYQCEYQSPINGKRCECTIGLQVDHLYPYAWGGGHEIKNTRILCTQHNFFYGVQTFGRSKMLGHQ